MLWDYLLSVSLSPKVNDQLVNVGIQLNLWSIRNVISDPLLGLADRGLEGPHFIAVLKSNSSLNASRLSVLLQNWA